MNERIKELADQAGLYVGVQVAHGVELERFAELVAEQTHTNNKAKWYQEGYEAGQRDEQERIKKEQHQCYVERGSK